MKEQRAQTLILVALMLTVLLGFVALSLDGGNAYLQRRRMQNAADAGALAAARAKCMGTPADYLAYGKALCESQDNGGASCALAATADGARAVASITVGTWFARVLGINILTVSAAATGACSSSLGTGNLLPITLPNTGFGPGKFYTIWDKDEGDQGSYGWLRWENPECGKNLPDWVSSPACAPFLVIPVTINTKTGVDNAAFDTLWSTWMCKSVTVPIYDTSKWQSLPGNNNAYPIIGFAQFKVTAMCGPGNPGSLVCPGSGSPVPSCSKSERAVTGQFVTYVVDPNSKPGGPDYGVYRVYLTD